MTLCYTHRSKDPFVRFDKRIVMDPNISWKAKGLLTYAFSRPEDWKFYRKEMIKHSCDGEKAFDSGIKELESAGYLHRTTKHEEGTGKLQGWEWHFYEIPIDEDEFKKRHRNPHFSVNGETASTPKGNPTKKEEESKNENNNPVPLEHSASPVVVPSFLESLPDVEDSLKQKLATQWKEDPGRLERACEISRKQPDPESRVPILLSALKNDWKPRASSADVEEKNRLWSDENLRSSDGLKIGPYTFRILTNYVEFTPDGCAEPKIFRFDDASFQSQVNKMIKLLKQ